MVFISIGNPIRIVLYVFGMSSLSSIYPRQSRSQLVLYAFPPSGSSPTFPGWLSSLQYWARCCLLLVTLVGKHRSIEKPWDAKYRPDTSEKQRKMPRNIKTKPMQLDERQPGLKPARLFRDI